MNEKAVSEKVVRSIMLEANSSRQAWYQIRLLRVGEGYVVEKTSGARTASGVKETYFRQSLEEAEEKFYGILNEKIRSHGERKYRRVGEGRVAQQLALFG